MKNRLRMSLFIKKGFLEVKRVIEQDETMIKGLLKRINEQELDTLSTWVEQEQLNRTIEQVMRR